MKNEIKGYIAGILTCVVLFGAVFAASSQVREIFFGVQVSVNGEVQSFDDDMQPFIMDGRTFLPVRTVADALGVGIDFDEATNTVLLTQPHFMEELLDAFAPMFQSIFDSMGLDVAWDEAMAELAYVDWNVMMDMMLAMFDGIDWGALMGGMFGDVDWGAIDLSYIPEFIAGVPDGHALLGSTWSWDFMPTYIYTFNADGTGARGLPGMVEDFEWSVPAEGHLMLNFGIMVESYSYEINGGAMVWNSRQIPGLVYALTIQ